MTDDELKLLAFLKQMGVKEISKKEKKLLLEFIKESHGFAMARKQLEFLYSLNKVLIKSYTKVSVTNMMKINEALDNELFSKLLMIYYEIQKKGLNKQDGFLAFKEATLKVLENNQNTNLKIQEIVSGEFSKLEAVRNVLYISMLDTNKADLLLQNCIKRSKLFLNSCDLTNLATMITCLRENYSLSDDDLVNISTRCATFFAFSSAQKLQNIETTINGFKEFVVKGLTEKNAEKKIFSFLDKNFKDIIMNAPSFVTANPDSIKETIRFLMGETLESIIAYPPRNVKNLKGSFTSGQLAKIYSDSITALTIPVAKIGEFTSNISLAYKNCYGCDLNLDRFINGRNFSGIAQLRSEDYLIGGKVEEILDLLKPFVSEKDMQNLLENNVSFLIASVDEVKNSLKSAILESRNQEELKANVLYKIKSHFGRYEGFDPNIERKESVAVDRLKKVVINDMEEESLLGILGRLDTTTQDIEKWKNSWSREEKELRELQIQLDLEDMLSQLNYIEEMAKESLTDIEAFDEENEIIVSLLQDVMIQHASLLTNNKLNKNLKTIDAQIVFQVSRIIDSINKNIDSVIKYYNDQLTLLNHNLEIQVSKKKTYEENAQKLQALEEELANLNVSEETIEKNKEKVKQLSKLLEKGEKEFKETQKENSSVDRSIGKLYHAFIEYEKEQSFIRPMDIGKDNYFNTLYMFTWFAKILIKEELIFPSDAEEIASVNHKESDMAYSYKQYRALLPENIRNLTDEMYNRYKNNKQKTHEIYMYLGTEMDKLGIDTSNLQSVKQCLSVLREEIHLINRAQTQNRTLMAKKYGYQKSIMETDINFVQEEINRLKTSIEEYVRKIKKQEISKII